MQQIDLRIVRVGIEVNGVLKTYDKLAITATGTKYANQNQNECEVKIANLDKSTRDYLLSETSPFNANKTRKLLILDAGRVSDGVSRIFIGNITKAFPSQPPDITVTLKCLTQNFNKGVIVSRTGRNNQSLKSLSQEVAKDLGVALNFEATDKQIGNYAYSGSALKQVNKLNDMGNVNAYIDDDILVVKDTMSAISNSLKLINIDSGMIGIPETTEQGIKVKYLLDNKTKLGGRIRIQSKIYPSTSGDYSIFKLSFEIANRDGPFYWIAEAKRI